MNGRARHDVRNLSRQLVGHFAAHVAPCATLPGDALRGDITAVTRICLELTIDVLEGRQPDDKVEFLQQAAAGWAREGIPIDTVHHAVHEGFKLAFDLLLNGTDPQQRPDDPAQLLLRVLDTITPAVALAYVREHQAAVTEHHTAVHTLVSALLSGHPTSTMARESGIEIASAYAVLAVNLPRHPDETHPGIDPKVVARRKLRRLQTELARGCGGRALSLLSVDGGTVLIPEEVVADGDLDRLVDGLSAAAQVPVTATVVTAATQQIPDSADRAHELLDTVLRLGSGPGLYRFSDLAMEYQLTRPGPGLDRLGALLDPLDDHPDLLETLRSHLATGLSRQRTARQLQVHTNTVDYRLKRIGQLTGMDPAQPSGLWYLRAALVARTYREAGPTDPEA
ncbi:PucR family transcriptional regulator [Nocardia transvalensis]|uniref:PucR family transcriptional regulator n=1 Tax=Nocardia transvalensis TaxID=37333 RepID=UPI001895FFE3|nr:helix-turn-helix domain-containing protein [Nocardia transvalensis]MBF6330799.1 helix-turn-helix domain-containing protein [Nocardia transvalensis]